MLGTAIGRHGTAARSILRWRDVPAAGRLRGVSLRLRWEPDISRDSMFLIGILVGLANGLGLFATPVDALAYWQAGTSSDLYPLAWAEVGTGYLFYPPPVAQLSTLLQPLGWSVFVLLFMATTFAAFWYCAGRWSLPLVALGIPWFLGIGPEEPAKFLAYALIGNLQWILAAATILAIRRPALWSIELVAKVTTAIGWWWHVLRGEWRAAAIGAGASLLIIGFSFALAPNLWFEFAAFALQNGTMADPPMPQFPVPLGVRLATAVPLLVWGARTNRPWTVPFVVGWSLPALHGASFLPFWVAAWHLRGVTSPPRNASLAASHPMADQ